ncbi:carboxypeptidase regulatory-like domain-containing protein [Lacipirellula parvula]|uniref:Peptidase M56 domain-containing protein n=1 Tax=Lacipirellula parvula TaxID=2650471 RepID=A0A5K7XAQ2_9BACT|nr:carboxypeptidase regulatory-like domain-containing protein [Lacipirellula parvula]BBO33780.1 hypothetical protein PLANPX_3392 [Lacipirellula parvula]
MALLAPWLADFQLLAAALLLSVMLAIALLRQPAQRLAVAKSTLVALAALALLCAIPGWSLVHLLNEQPPPAPTASSALLADFAPAPHAPAMPSFEPVAAAPSPVVTTIAEPPTPPPAQPINWPAAIVTLYAGGCALVALWLAIGGLLARRVLSQATPAPPELEQLLAQITGPVAHPPQLLLSNHIAAPVAMGLRRPAILLPASTFPIQHSAFNLSPAQLLPILAHEWAHLEHRDLHTLAATRLLLILLWPQPLFWLLRRTIRLDQETLADAAAADRAGRLDYAQQLLAWARTASTQRPPRLAGAVGLWEGPSQLKRRIAVLLNEKFNVMRSCSAAWRRVCIASLAVAALALSLVTLQPTPVVGNDDATNAKPAAGTTDNTADNKASAPTAEQPADFTIAPVAQYEEAGVAEPNTYAGICVDEQDKPLPGVEVSLFVYGNFDVGNPPAENVEPAAVMKTDAYGRFRFENVVELAENHAVDAASKQVAVIAQAPGRATGGSLESISLVASRGKTSRLPLVPAATFSGRVTDLAGNPIADAVVAANWGYLISNAGLLTRTDAEGRFQLNSMPPATPVVPASVIVTHPDYVAKFAKQASNSTEFDVKMRHGSIIAGRVVYQPADRNGPRVPVAGVRVWAAGSRPVVANDEEDGQRIAVTDADGRYELRGLVGGTYAVNASAPDRVTEGLAGIEAGAQSLPMEPGSTVEVPDMVLTDGAIVRMKLIDAATGKPLLTAKGARAHITPRRIADVERPYAFRIARPIDEQAETELRLPAGRYSFFTLLPAVSSGSVWTSVSERITTSNGEAEFVDVVEGATVEITVPMSSFSPADYHNPVSPPSPSLDLQIPSLSPYYAPQPTGVGVSGVPVPLGAVPTTPPTTISAPQAGIAPPTAATTGDRERQAKEVAERGSALGKQVTPGPNVFMGFCIDEAAQPIAGVDVSLFVYNGSAQESVEPLARTRTGSDGKFEFNEPVDVAKEFPNGVPEENFVTAPVKVIAAVAKSPGLTTEFQNEVLHRFVKRGQGAMLQMKPAGKLTGRVTDGKGQPVAGAVVNTTLSVGGYVPGANLSARTDADGRYTIDDLPRFDADERVRELAAARERKEPWAMFSPPGPALSVQHSDFATRRVNLQVVPGELNLALLPGSTVKGRVVAKLRGPSDESKPLANVPVWIMRTMQPIRDPKAAYTPVEQQTTTDDDGNYAFTSLPASEYAVTATAPDLTTAGVTGVAVGAGQTAAAPDVVLTPGAIVRVKLLDAANKQPFKFEAGRKGYILPQRLTSGAIGAPRMDSQISDFTVDGVGEAQLAPGRYGLFVSIPGEGLDPNLESRSLDGKSTVAEFEVREGETLELAVPLIEFPLQMASGVVAAVAPAATDGAVVETQASPPPETSHFQPSTTPADGEQPGAVPLKPQSATPSIDDAGSPAEKTPSAAYTAPSKTTHQTVGMGEWALTPLEPSKHQPNALQLHIVDESNQPLAGVEATLYSAASSRGEAKPIKTLVTDAAGNALFADVVPADQIARFAALKAAGEFIGGSQGTYLIALKYPGLATALLYQSAGELALGGSKRTIMLRPAVKLSGRVTDPAGKPVADAVVSAGAFAGSRSIAGVNAVATDAAGRFEFDDRGPFKRAAANEANQFMSLAATAHSPAPQPSPAAAEDPTTKNVSDLVVTHPKFAVTRIEGGDVPGNADVQMLAATSIVGRVIDHQSGAPVAGVTVQALGDPTGPPQIEKEGNVLAYRVPYSHSASVRTDAQGNYRLDNLPAGTYNLWVDSESTPGRPFKHASQGASGVVTTAGNEPTQAPDMIVGRPATVTVQLVDAETGEPLQLDGNAVAVPMALRGSDYRQQQNPHQRVPISKDGTFTFSSLPGRFRIGVEVVDKPGISYQVIYRSGDDFDRSAAAIDLHFGESVSTKLAVRSMPQLQQFRAEQSKAYELLRAGKSDEAIAAFDAMVAARPNDYEPISGRCYAYRTSGHYAEAIADAEEMLKRFPDDSQARYILADLLAISPVEATRDGKRALKYAEELVAMAKANHADAATMARYLGFVAAAHAESGDFAKAIAVQEEAIESIPSSENKGVRQSYERRLELYRAGKPFRGEQNGPEERRPMQEPANQGAVKSLRSVPLATKPVEPPPVSPTLQSSVGHAAIQSADIQAVSLIDRTKPWSYPMGGLEPKPLPLEFKSSTLGDAVK